VSDDGDFAVRSVEVGGAGGIGEVDGSVSRVDGDTGHGGKPNFEGTSIAILLAGRPVVDGNIEYVSLGVIDDYGELGESIECFFVG